MTELVLAKNKIQIIENIEKLTKLKTVNFSANKLTSVGDAFLTLLDLEQIYLAENQFTKLEGVNHLVLLIIKF